MNITMAVVSLLFTIFFLTSLQQLFTFPSAFYLLPFSIFQIFLLTFGSFFTSLERFCFWFYFPSTFSYYFPSILFSNFPSTFFNCFLFIVFVFQFLLPFIVFFLLLFRIFSCFLQSSFLFHFLLSFIVFFLLLFNVFSTYFYEFICAAKGDKDIT